MANELVREKIVLDHRIGRETTQVLIEGDLIVPDIKPDMAVILQAGTKVHIDRSDVSNDRVNFIGRMEFQVLYLARSAERPVHSMSVSAAIDDFINMEGVAKEMWVDVEAEIANIDYKMVNDRKINYRAVVDVTIYAEKSEPHEIIVDISGVPHNQLLHSTLNLNRSVENKSDRMIIKDELAIPAGKPNIREVLECNASVANKDVRVLNGRVTITGDLYITTLYKGDSDLSLIEFVEHEIPFNGSIEIGGAKDGMTADAMLSVQDQYVQVRPDADGEDRVLDIEASVLVTLKVTCQDSIEILEDAYCINKRMRITKKPIKYPRLVCRNRNQSPIKEVVQIDSGCPDIMQIFKVKGKASVDDIKIVDDKVVVEGVVVSDVLYLAESDDTPLYSYRAMLPYRQIIETKNAAKDMEALLNVTIDHVGFNMLSGREMELRFLLTFNTHVLEHKMASLITDIEIEDMDRVEIDNMASMTVYVIQPGDTLWKVAKRYNTSIDEILAINDIEDPDRVYPGQKLLILKKIVGE